MRRLPNNTKLNDFKITVFESISCFVVQKEETEAVAQLSIPPSNTTFLVLSTSTCLDEASKACSVFRLPDEWVFVKPHYNTKTLHASRNYLSHRKRNWAPVFCYKVYLGGRHCGVFFLTVNKCQIILNFFANFKKGMTPIQCSVVGIFRSTRKSFFEIVSGLSSVWSCKAPK